MRSSKRWLRYRKQKEQQKEAEIVDRLLDQYEQTECEAQMTDLLDFDNDTSSCGQNISDHELQIRSIEADIKAQEELIKHFGARIDWTGNPYDLTEENKKLKRLQDKLETLRSNNSD